MATSAPQIPQAVRPGATVLTRLEAVEIVRWRGYATSAFHARRLSDHAVIATSPTFRWRKSAPPPDAGAARDAYDQLATELREHGWHDAGSTCLWYEHRFEQARLQSAPPASEMPPLVDDTLGSAPAEVAVTAEAPKPVAEAPWEEPEQPVLQPLQERASEESGRSRRGRRMAFGLAIAAVILAGGTFAVHAGISNKSTKGVAARPVAAAAEMAAAPTSAASVKAPASPASVTAAVSPASVTAAVSPARLEVRGVGKGSWLEVRLGSAKGRVLFSGVVHDGVHRRFHARRLWVTFGGATNLVITVNGVPQRLQGTVEALVTDRGLTAP